MRRISQSLEIGFRKLSRRVEVLQGSERHCAVL